MLTIIKQQKSQNLHIPPVDKLVAMTAKIIIFEKIFFQKLQYKEILKVTKFHTKSSIFSGVTEKNRAAWWNQPPPCR